MNTDDPIITYSEIPSFKNLDELIKWLSDYKKQNETKSK